jgi:hypothetical protein
MRLGAEAAIAAGPCVAAQHLCPDVCRSKGPAGEDTDRSDARENAAFLMQIRAVSLPPVWIA